MSEAKINNGIQENSQNEDKLNESQNQRNLCNSKKNQKVKRVNGCFLPWGYNNNKKLSAREKKELEDNWYQPEAVYKK